MLLSCCQGKPQAKGLDRLGGRSRIKIEEDDPYSYLPDVSLGLLPAGASALAA